MNMIICDNKCRHQREGYCGLNTIAQLTSEANTKCGYFEPASVYNNAKKDNGSYSSRYPQSEFYNYPES